MKLSNNKLCGNCAGDHKIIDCPVITVNKAEYLKNKEYVDRVGETHLNEIAKNKVIVEHLKKRIEELDEYIIDQYVNHNNIAGIEEDQLELLQEILGEENG